MLSMIKTVISGRGLHISYPLLLVFVFVVGLLISVPGASSIEAADTAIASNVSSLDRLHMNLFINYDKNSHPTAWGMPTNTTIGLTVRYIDIDEMNGKITLHCWLSARWMDERRTWRPSEYDNITQLNLRAQEVWKPQITLFNAANDDGQFIAETHVTLANDGSFLWVPPAIYTAYCNLNMRQWPYDKQICKLHIGTWSLNNIDAEYTKLKQALNYDELVQSTEWEIINGDAQYVRRDDYNYIEFIFTVQRRSSMYTAVIYTPALCIVLLALSAFWLPPQMGEKILLNGILIVLIAAFLMYFAQLLPVLADNTPLIVIFYSSCLLMLSLSTIVEVLVLYLSTATHKQRVPGVLKRLLNGKLGAWLLLSHFTYEAEAKLTLGNGRTQELDEHLYDNADESTDPQDINPTEAPSMRALQYDWILLATAVDRICFVGFSVVFLGLSITYAM